MTNPTTRKIFSYLEHRDLINFSIAYPCFTNEILSATYWKKVDTYLDGNILTRDEFNLLLNHIGKTVESLCFDCQLCIEQEDLINNLTNVKKLELFNVHSDNIIKSICDNMTSLTELKLEYWSLNDSHVDLIRASVKRLHSFSFCTGCNINKGTFNLIKSMKFVRKFGLRSSTISEE